MEKMKMWTIAAAGFVCAALSSSATTFNSDGTDCCGPYSVQAIHDAQATYDGDTITIPAGTFTWSAGLTLTKALTLQGAGIGQTIIQWAAVNTQMILWTLPNNPSSSRITGIEFQDGGGSGKAAPAGCVINGSNLAGWSPFRLDHCYWNNVQGSFVFDTVRGVIDHNTIYQSTHYRVIPLYFYATRWNGGTSGYGDQSWHDPANFGAGDCTYVEDNVLTFNFTGHGTFTDGLGGCRFVIRHNTINNGTINNHGTESGGRIRGARLYELYANNFVGSGYSKFLAGTRSGTTLIYDNTIRGFWGTEGTLGMGNYRTHNRFPIGCQTNCYFGGADGTNAWDVNHPGGPFFSGTAAANSLGTSVQVSGVSWTANQWVGYSVKRTSETDSDIDFGLIMSNTNNSITYTDNGGYANGSLTFTAGDSMQFWKVDQVMDGIGRGQGSVPSPIATPPVVAGWNDQVLEPMYCWNNVITDAGNAHLVWRNGSPSIRQNEHFFNDTPMPGYTPYTYPHPLTLQ